MKNGVPYDIAESWSDEERYAACIAYGEFDGGEWDWRRMKWVKRQG